MISQYGTVAGTAVDQFLTSFKNPPGLVTERYESVPTLDAGIARIRSDPEYAFVWASASIDYILKDGGACDVTHIPGYNLLPSSVSPFVQKDSMYTGILNF